MPRKPAAAPEPMRWEEAQRAAEMFHLLASPARVFILSRISSLGAVVCSEMVDPTGLAQPTISHHLRILTEAGLVVTEKAGVFVYYRLAPGALNRVDQALAGVR